ncbi:MAG TPA: hypothetical protein VM802_23100 [Chitinophaga sp.]|uniref:hypothetical protein n=1 Tax=Chitinophaga sp. TaxID=1869181 RepID=UPI002D0D0C02|nr:hypothetical protein [Chitinophaga sp.]HVI47778.1 hypothetical protein [Chitinophaga sp.]
MNLKRFKNVLPLILVSAALVTMSFAFIKNAAGTRHADLTQYSGKELFRGIFFSQGEISQRIPSMQPTLAKWDKYPAATKKMYQAFYDDMIANIEKNDPGYFEAFKKKIATRNYTNVAEAMVEGGRAIFEAGLRSPKYNPFFSSIEEMAKSGDINRFDLRTPDGKQALAKYLSEKIKARQQLGSNAVQNKNLDVQASIAVPIFVLWAAVWDAVAAVNYAAAVTIETVAVVHFAVYAQTQFWPKNSEVAAADGITKLASERLVAEIANI